MKLLIVTFVCLFISTSVQAQEIECPIQNDGGICLTKEQKEEIKKSLQELETIHNSPVNLTLEPINIVRDWENRVYINGQKDKPIKLKLKIGQTIDRDLELKLPVQLYYREAPPPPMFRLRIRAQVGLLSTPLFSISEDTSNVYKSLDGGVGWDWFGINDFNTSVYTGVRSSGIQIGYDLTKNFGLTGGFHVMYDGFKGTGALQLYFSFN